MQDKENTSENENLKDLKSVPSIGNLSARSLIQAGYDSISKLKKADVEDLASIDNIGENLASKIIKEIEKSSLSGQEAKENVTFEFRCPVCERFTWSEGKNCRECEEPIDFYSSVVLPERGIIEDPKKTLAEVEEKILNDGGDAESWFIRGSILESMGAYHKALESFDKVIELDPLFDYVWNAKAQLSLKIGETEEAAKAYKLAFDARKAPKNIADQIEDVKKYTPKKKTELKKKDGLDKELDEKISKARNLLGFLDKGEKDISELTAKLDTVTEERIRGNKEKALEMVKEVIKEYQSSTDLKDKLKDLSNQIQELDEFSEELSEEVREIIGIDDAIPRAEKAKEKGDFEEASDLISSYLESKSSLSHMSNKLSEMISLKNKVENLDVEKEFLNSIDQDFEKVKEICKADDYQKAEDLLENLIEELRKRKVQIEKEKEKHLKEIEEIIENGEREGLDLEIVKKDLKKVKEGLEIGEETKDVIIDQLEEVKQRAEKVFSIRSNISEIEDEINKYREILNPDKYEEGIEEIERRLKKRNFEKAIDLSQQLKNDLEKEIKGIEEKEQLESEAEAKLADARKRLSELRETEFDLDNLKKILKNSNEHRKKGDFQKSIALTEKFIDSAEKMIDLSKLFEKINNEIEKLDEKDLVDKERIDYEIDQYLKLVKVEKYELAEKFLSETLEELKEALDEEKMIPPSEEKLDESATQIPTQIKEKVRNVKELNNLVERAQIEIKVNREPLKEAIIKIKELEYLEANEILTDWKESLIDRLDYEMGDRLNRLNEELDELDIPSIQRRGKAILENVERKWDLKAYEKALNTLIYASSFIQNLQEKKTKSDKQIYLSSELIDDIQESVDSTEEIQELLKKAKDNRKEEEVFQKTLEEIKENVLEHLGDTLDDEVKKLEERLEALSRNNVVVAISNLIDMKSSLDEENVEKASWYMREYSNVIEKD